MLNIPYTEFIFVPALGDTFLFAVTPYDDHRNDDEDDEAENPSDNGRDVLLGDHWVVVKYILTAVALAIHTLVRTRCIA